MRFVHVDSGSSRMPKGGPFGAADHRSPLSESRDVVPGPLSTPRDPCPRLPSTIGHTRGGGIVGDNLAARQMTGSQLHSNVLRITPFAAVGESRRECADRYGELPQLVCMIQV